MADIIIEKAPKEYQKYLTIGDAEGDFNKKIDNSSEAKIAAERFCKDNPASCQDFLNYLEKSNYTFLRINIDSQLVSPDELGAKLKGLIKALEEGKTWEEWRKTADTLIELASQDSPPGIKAKIVDSLIKAQESAPTGFRFRVIFTLGRIASSPAISPGLKLKMADCFLKALADEDQDVRYEAVFALRNLILSSSVPQYPPQPKTESKEIPAGPKAEINARNLANKVAEPGWSQWTCQLNDNGIYSCTREEKATLPVPDLSDELKARIGDFLMQALKNAPEETQYKLANSLRELMLPYSNAILLAKCDEIIAKNPDFGVTWKGNVEQEKPDWTGKAGAIRINKIIEKLGGTWGINPIPVEN